MSTTRRRLLQGLGGLGALALAPTYAVAVEPMRLAVTRYHIVPRVNWSAGQFLRIAALADIHACDPWMTPERIAGIVERTNALEADVVVLLGDYESGSRVVRHQIPATEWARPLGALQAPLGVFAILGNHDWWEDGNLLARGDGIPKARRALEGVGIRVLENDAVRLDSGRGPVWLAGLGDQIAYLTWPHGRRPGGRLGNDDLTGTLARIPAGEPVVLLAHEPDIFPDVPADVTLTLCGHTHGGQVRLFGYSPLVPSRFQNRYAYGHVREQGDLVVSGGLGCSIAPVRFGVPPEIVVVELGINTAS